MKVALVDCFDTFLDRETALLRFFRARGDEVTPFLSDFRHIEKEYRKETPRGFRLIHALAYQKNMSFQRMYSHDQYAKAIRAALEREKWDLIWAIVPPNSLVKQCAQFRIKHQETKLIFDVNDMWPESFPMGNLTKLPPFQAWRNVRDKWLPNADAVVTECELFRKLLPIPGDCPSGTIYYCKQDNVPCPTGSANIPNDFWSLCYLGSINHIIDIDAIATIIKQLRQLRPVKLHIIGTGERKDVLIQQASLAGAEVLDHGAIYDNVEKQKIFDQCHFGLNAMKSSVCVGLTMKSIDYLAGGLPLINTIPGDTWDLIEEQKLGLNWMPTQEPDWSAFEMQNGRVAARNFFESELDYAPFATKVEQLVCQLF